MKFDKDITKIKRVTFFLRHSVYTNYNGRQAMLVWWMCLLRFAQTVKRKHVGRKLLITLPTTTTFRNPLADLLGTRRGPPLVRGPQFENRWPIRAACPKKARWAPRPHMLRNGHGSVCLTDPKDPGSRSS